MRLLDIQMDKNCVGKVYIENIQGSQEEIHVARKQVMYFCFRR